MPDAAQTPYPAYNVLPFTDCQYAVWSSGGLYSAGALYLKGDFDVIESRLKARKGHFFKTQMLVTQFETLQEPGADESDVLVVDIDQPLEGVVASTIEVINKRQ